MIKSVNFFPRYIVEQHIFNDEYAVISITDNDQIDAKIVGCDHILRIQFLDIEEPIQHPKFHQNYLFDKDKALEIIQFVQHIHSLCENKKMIVHCEAGICRSAAVALFIHTLTGCTFDNQHNANFANKLVIKILEDNSNIKIQIPNKPDFESSIFLFSTI